MYVAILRLKYANVSEGFSIIRHWKDIWNINMRRKKNNIKINQPTTLLTVIEIYENWIGYNVVTDHRDTGKVT